MGLLSEGRRNSGIDALRGISILTVILLHLNIRVPFKDTFLGGNLPDPVYRVLFFSGFYGVAIFFVISGFLITSTTLNRWKSLPDISVKGFYFMRMARILPLLVLLLVTLSILHLSGTNGYVINPDRTTLGRSILAALTFHINLLEIKVGYLPGPWDILWSLSIEEVFYLFFPLLCFLCRKEWHFVALVSVFLIISPFARTTWFPGNDLGDRNHFAYLDAISIGCVAALIAKKVHITKKLLTWSAVTGWTLFLFVFITRKWVSFLGLTKIGLNITFLAIGTALILIWMQKLFVNGNFNPSKYTLPLRYLGKNSYEIYLTHMFVVILLTGLFKSLNLSGEWIWVLYFTAIIFSALLGDTVARFFSNPINLKLRLKLK